MLFANSGEDALDQLAGGIERTLIAILSDINMPGIDGLDLLGEIKQRYPELPVMMVTAYGDDERRRRAEELGATEFLTKPVDFDHLKAQLRRLPSAAPNYEGSPVDQVTACPAPPMDPGPGEGRLWGISCPTLPIGMSTAQR